MYIFYLYLFVIDIILGKLSQCYGTKIKSHIKFKIFLEFVSNRPLTTIVSSVILSTPIIVWSIFGGATSIKVFQRSVLGGWFRWNFRKHAAAQVFACPNFHPVGLDPVGELKSGWMLSFAQTPPFPLLFLSNCNGTLSFCLWT